MRKLFILMAGLAVMTGALFASPSSAFAKIDVFACSPEWAALAEEIGGDLVNVKAATNARQDVHHIRAKPSLLAAMRRADLVFCTGASLESGWLPILIKKAGGPDIQPETIGWIMASDYVEKLQEMNKFDRSMGHVHPEGNPHIHLDPHNILTVANVLAERFLLLDQDNTQSYLDNLDTFESKWKPLISQWETDAAALKGKNVVVYHNAWAYLVEWLGMNVVATLEPKPGIPPTASHLETVLNDVRGKEVTAILVTPYENEDAAHWLSGKTGIPALSLPYTVGGSDQADSLEGLFSKTVSMLKDAHHDIN